MPNTNMTPMDLDALRAIAEKANGPHTDGAWLDHIATFNPSLVLDLLALVGEREEKVDAWKSLLDDERECTVQLMEALGVTADVVNGQACQEAMLGAIARLKQENANHCLEASRWFDSLIKQTLTLKKERTEHRAVEFDSIVKGCLQAKRLILAGKTIKAQVTVDAQALLDEFAITDPTQEDPRP